MPPASRGLPTTCRLSQLRRVRSVNPSSPRSTRSIKLPTRRQLPHESPPRPLEAQLAPKQDVPPISPSPPKPISRLRSLLQSHYFSHFRKWLWASARTLLLIGPPLALLTSHSPYQVMWVQGPSMSPYLNTHWSKEKPNTEDTVVVRRDRYELNLPWASELSSILFSRRKRDSSGPTKLQRGMLIAFYAPHNPDRIVVKRIVGLPGDRVTPLPGARAYLDNNSTHDSATPDISITIPWNHLWVEGDYFDANFFIYINGY